MGYCYDQHNRLCCDICGKAGGVRKIKCPVNWCQPVAACEPCRKAKKHIPDDKHAHCREIQAEHARQLAAFRAGGLHLGIIRDGKDGSVRVADPWYHPACDYFNRTWFTDPAMLFAQLTAMGHTFEEVEEVVND